MVIRQIVFMIFAVIFLVLGAIGLLLPVIPQVPFLVTGTVFLAGGSKRFKAWLMRTKLYREHGYKLVKRYAILRHILGEDLVPVKVEVSQEQR